MVYNTQNSSQNLLLLGKNPAAVCRHLEDSGRAGKMTRVARSGARHQAFLAQLCENSWKFHVKFMEISWKKFMGNHGQFME